MIKINLLLLLFTEYEIIIKMSKIVENAKVVKIGITVCVLALLLLSLGVVIRSNAISHFKNENKGKLVAVVNGYNVYESDLADRLNMLANGQKITIEDIPENILKAMVLEVAVNHQIDENAKKEGYNNDKIILQQVKNYKTGLIREKYLNDKVYSKITEEELLREYNKIVNNLKGKEERNIKHILVETEEEIERVRRNVLRTGNFEKIAKQKSIDTASAQNGGDLGYVLKEELVPEFGEMAFMLKVGEISKPVKTQYGWHIIKVEDARPAQFLGFDDVKNNIKNNLEQQAIQQFLLKTTKDAKIDLKVQPKQLSQQPVETENTQK